MAEMGSWNGHTFIVSPALVRSFTDLSIKGSSTTEDKTSNKQKYVARKAGDPYEVSMTVGLDARFGCDVSAEALALAKEAREGASNYLYICGRQLFDCKMMLTEASASDIEFTPAAKWLRCSVKLSFKQASKDDSDSGSSGSSGSSKGGSSKGGGSSKKASVKTQSTVNKDFWTAAREKAEAELAQKSAAKTAVNKQTSTAKKASATKKASAGQVRGQVSALDMNKKLKF